MYQGTGELKNFQSSKSSTQVTNQCSSTIKVQVKCHSFTVEIKFKCDDLDHQVSITNS